MAFAKSVVALELERHADDLGVADRIVVGLAATLGRLVGPAGVEALLSRSLVIARRRCPALVGVRALPSGHLDGFREALAGQDAPTIVETSELLVSHFVELLVVLVGEDMGMRLAGAGWPDAKRV